MKRVIKIITLFIVINSYAQTGKLNIEYVECNKEYCDTVYIYFRDKYNDRILSHYRFGVNTNREELPIHYVFERDYFGEITSDSVVLIRHKVNRYDPEKDKLYGYFSRGGYYGTGEGGRFLIPNNVQKIVLDVTPTLSQVTFKAYDSEIDSIKYIINKEKREEYSQDYISRYVSSPYDIWQNKTRTITKKDFKSRQDGLSVVSYTIYPNDYFKIDVIVYRKGKIDYQHYYEVKYQPWTETVINVW
jgi:hypothetical protein